jgi:hypothetical protein
MRIVSQNKRRDFDYNGMIIVIKSSRCGNEKGDTKYEIHAEDSAESSFIIGEYATDIRAYRVMEEIRNTYELNMAMVLKGDNIRGVKLTEYNYETYFYMPKE